MNEIKGSVHSIESFSTVDGPGTRFVTFMQGCPLRCIYCQNPDTWKFEDGKEMTVEDIMDQIVPQKQFYEKNNGGLTVSGGDPMAQAAFVGNLFESAKKQCDITTAIDTSGCIPISDAVEHALNHCDYVLIDVKHVDPMKHVIITGRAMGLIQAFITHIQTLAHIKIWVRHVVVPGYTTAEDDIKKIAEYIGSLQNVERVDLLPYHDMGASKWELLERDYKLKNITIPSKALILEIAEKMAQYGGIHPQSIYSE